MIILINVFFLKIVCNDTFVCFYWRFSSDFVVACICECVVRIIESISCAPFKQSDREIDAVDENRQDEVWVWMRVVSVRGALFTGL